MTMCRVMLADNKHLVHVEADRAQVLDGHLGLYLGKMRLVATFAAGSWSYWHFVEMASA